MDNKGPPPPYGMHAEPTAPHPQVVYSVHQTAGVNVGPESTNCVCPSCHAHISTRVEMLPTTKTHLFALVLCLIGCWPCCLFPYCMDSCRGVNHFCPSCGAYLGTYNQ